MTLNKAKRLALGTLGEGLGIIDQLTRCKRAGWFFFCQRGVIVVVTHCGEVHPLPGEGTAEEVIRDFESMQQRRQMPHAS